MALVLMFLKANWKPIAILVVLLGIYGYIKVLQLEKDHYEKNYNEVVALRKQDAKNAKIQQDVLTKGKEEIEAKYRNTLADANSLVVVNARLNEEKIKSDKELASVKLSLIAVRLFNASKQATDDSPPKAVEGNATTTNPAKETSSLKDLLLVVNENDKEHLKCINTLVEWQKWYIDVQALVDKANAVQP